MLLLKRIFGIMCAKNMLNFVKVIPGKL